jgi:DNA invertase Pin-like site-specific DNA recombinase
MAQVEHNVESRERQYELAERAVALGWPAGEVVVVDEDQGRSGKSADGRNGFQGLVAEVGLGRVGIVVGIEVSRLARGNADWYQLLDLCALTDTLIADSDGIYHPGLHNDRLVLGLKGTMSEAELHVLRARLRGGSLHKAGKGELRLPLPAGLEYDETGRVRVTPDEAVADAIATVFSHFEELASARQVMLRLLGENRQLPRRATSDRRVRWASRPTGRSTTSSPTRCSRARTRTDASAPSDAWRAAWSVSGSAARRVRSGMCASKATTPATSPSSAISQTRSGCARTGARRAGRAAALRARAGRCCRG